MLRNPAFRPLVLNMHVAFFIVLLAMTMVAHIISAEEKRTSSEALPNVVFVSSANSEWYERTKDDLSHTILDPENRPNHELRLYHEDELPAFPGVTMINLFDTVPWLKQELIDKESGLNKYYQLTQYFDPTVISEVGRVKVAYALLMKVAAIQHAIHSVPDNTIVFWVDTDVSFRDPMPAPVLKWLKERDITYIPFQLKVDDLIPDDSYLADKKFDPTNENDLSKYLRYEYWSLETGLFTFLVSSKTKTFIDTVVNLYRGGMYNNCLKCYRGESTCRQPHHRLNLFLNDIFAFNFVVQSDIHGDSFFHLGLRHGWFAMHGYTWGSYVWGNGAGHYLQHLVPVNRSDSLVTNFYIGEYVFHHFGTHHKGGLAAQLFNQEDPRWERESWRRVTQDILDYSVSLKKYLRECIMRNPHELPDDCKHIIERASHFAPHHIP